MSAHRLRHVKTADTAQRTQTATKAKTAKVAQPRLVRLALPAVGGLMIAAASIGSVMSQESASAQQNHISRSALASTNITIEHANTDVNRSGLRQVPIAKKMKPAVEATMYVVRDTPIRTDNNKSAAAVDTAKKSSTVPITAVSKGEWTQIVYGSDKHWVKSADIVIPDDADVTTKPTTYSVKQDESDDTDDSDKDGKSSGSKPSGKTSMAECSSGSGVESGLQPDTVRVHRSVCAKFPNVSSYGGTGGGGEHATGRALDIMLGGASGDAIAEYVRANAGKLGVSEVIWNQRIWTVQRSSEGWRSMSDRGGETANHKDHVHVTTYGDRGSAG